MNPNWNEVVRLQLVENLIFDKICFHLWGQAREKRMMYWKLVFLLKFHFGKPERSSMAVDTFLQVSLDKFRADGAQALFGCSWSTLGCPDFRGTGDHLLTARNGNRASLLFLWCPRTGNGVFKQYICFLHKWNSPLKIRGDPFCQSNRGSCYKNIPPAFNNTVFSVFR